MLKIREETGKCFFCEAVGLTVERDELPTVFLCPTHLEQAVGADLIGNQPHIVFIKSLIADAREELGESLFDPSTFADNKRKSRPFRRSLAALGILEGVIRPSDSPIFGEPE